MDYKQYEEYKQSLISSYHFMDKLVNARQETIWNESKFMDSCNIFEKVAFPSFVAGGCFMWFISMEHLSSVVSILFRVFLIAVAVICCWYSYRKYSNFKDDSGKGNYRSFIFPNCINERVQSDKEQLMRELVDELRRGKISVYEFEDRYRKVCEYDRYAERLMNDFEFSTAVFNRFN